MRAAWPADATRFLALRLGPGEDLREALTAAFGAAPEPSGFTVSCIGSLSRAALRHAGRTEETVTNAPFEIVSLSGTFSPDGCHLHAALSDEDGRMTGGHVLPGCVVRTTVEAVIGLTAAVRFAREVDEATGYAELVLRDGLGDRLGEA